MPSKQFENSVSEHEVFETPNGSDIKDIQLGSVATRSDAEVIQFIVFYGAIGEYRTLGIHNHNVALYH